MRRKMYTVVVVATMAVVAVACSSSSKTTATGSATTAGGSATTASGVVKPTGTPIKFGLMLPINSPSVSQPYVAAAAKVAAMAVNDAGGIMGRPVEIDVCDDQYTPQQAAICAQQLLVQDKVLMMVGDTGTQEPSLIPLLTTANTVSFASFAASLPSLQSPRVYVVTPNQASYWVVPQMIPAGTTKVAFMVGVSAIGDAAFKGAAAYFPKTVQVVPIHVPLTATDMQPFCLQLQQSGATVAVPQQNPGQVAKEIQVCNQIGLTKITWVIPTLQITTDVLTTVTQLNQPNVVVAAFGGDRIKQFETEIAKYSSVVSGTSATPDEVSVNAWLGVHLAAEFLPKVGSLDGAAIKAYLDQQTAFPTGATAPIDFTSTPVSALPRLKNLSASQGVIQNNQIVITNPTPLVASPTPPAP